MKTYSAVIYLAVLSCSRCDDGSSDSKSAEFHPARGCSQAKCGQTAAGAPSSLHKTEGTDVLTTITFSSDGFKYTYKGSRPIAVPNSDGTRSHTDVRSDSGVEDRRRGVECRNYLGAFGGGITICRRVVWSNTHPNGPSDEVSGNESSKTERTIMKTTTEMPDAAIGSSGGYGGPNEGEREAVDQPTDRGIPSFLPSPPNCGISLSDRIIGGMSTVKGKWPWLVAYGYKNKRTAGNELFWMCAGSLVTEKHTITVAHCANISTHYIHVARIGAEYLNSTLDKGAEETTVNRKIILHPDYSQQDKQHDIAIVTLKKPFSQRYRPICLPFRQDLQTATFVSKVAYVAGWGATSANDGFSSNVLSDVKLPIVDNAVCSDTYAPKSVYIKDNHICAGGEAGKDACRGDSGGPLMVKNNGETFYYLVGLVAFGSACGSQSVPGVYTRITSYLPWLEENLKN